MWRSRGISTTLRDGFIAAFRKINATAEILARSGTDHVGSTCLEVNLSDARPSSALGGSLRSGELYERSERRPYLHSLSGHDVEHEQI